MTGDRSFAASGLGGFAAGWFALGRLTWTSGPNAGRVAEVASHEVVAGARRLALLEAPVRPIASATTSSSAPAATSGWRPAATASPTS